MIHVFALTRRYLPPKPRRAAKYTAKQQQGRDGELIAFARLYEITRSKRTIQMSLFVQNVAPYFPLLSTDLRQFSQLLTTSGSAAYPWLESRFPPKHRFIRQICVFLQTADSIREAESFIRENALHLEKISADSYKQRKDMQAPLLGALNSIPMMITFLMVILILLQYMAMVQKSIQY